MSAPDTERGLAGKIRGRDWQSLARAAAASKLEKEPEILRELLVFLLHDTPYSIPVERVREIVRLRTITPMPRVPECVLGVIALRGEVVQVIDLRARLRGETFVPQRRSRIIVLHGDDERVTGVLVDSVREVVRLSESDISPSTSSDSEYVDELCKRGDEFISMLEIDRLLELDDV